MRYIAIRYHLTLCTGGVAYISSVSEQNRFLCEM